MKLVGLTMLLFFIVASGSQVQKDDPCKGETTFEMKRCAAKKYKEADDQLNKVYRELMAKLDNEGHKTSLRTAQQAWLKYRDSHCEFVSFLYEGGTLYSIVLTDCRTALTSSRTKELKVEIEDLDK